MPIAQAGNTWWKCTTHKGIALSSEKEGRVRKHSQLEEHLKTEGPHYIVPLVPAEPRSA